MQMGDTLLCDAFPVYLLQIGYDAAFDLCFLLKVVSDVLCSFLLGV